MDDIINKLEKMHTLIATDEDLKAVGATSSPKEIARQGKEAEKPLTNAPIKFDDRVEVLVPKGETANETREKDFEYMRGNLYSIVETSSDALNELAQIAARSQHPRAYEVLALLVKTIADANRDLMKIHAEKNSIEKNNAENVTPKSVTNNLFVGTTAELDEMCRSAIQDMKKKDVIEQS